MRYAGSPGMKKRVVIGIGATEATMELFETELSTLQGGPLPAINPINGVIKSYKFVTGFIKLLLGVIALFRTGSGAHLVCWAAQEIPQHSTLTFKKKQFPI